MAHQVIDQPGVVLHPPGAAAVGDARRLHDRPVIAHVVDYPNEAVIEHRLRLVEDLLQSRHGGPPRLGAGRALRLDLGLLLRGELHLDRSRSARTRHALAPSPSEALY